MSSVWTKHCILFSEQESNNIHNDDRMLGLKIYQADIGSDSALMKVKCNEDKVNVFSLHCSDDYDVKVP